MRLPKHKHVRRMREEHVHDFIAHEPSDAFVRVSVTETEIQAPGCYPHGTLIVDLERVTGPVVVRWTDADGKPQEMILQNKEG